jgi:16S rRNA (guanine966-N2)-methyltransferase
MRITGGQAKGRRLAPLKGMRIRPTSDKVREAIFDIIGHDLTDVTALDLFAGSGSLGIEALSRGALWTLFIDNSPRSVNLIRENLRLCGYETSGCILKRDLSRDLPWKTLLKGKRFDLIFVDPPYGRALIPPLLRQLSDKAFLASPSIVVAESSKADELPAMVGPLEMMDIRTYGETKVNIYQYEEEQ